MKIPKTNENSKISLLVMKAIICRRPKRMKNSFSTLLLIPPIFFHRINQALGSKSAQASNGEILAIQQIHGKIKKIKMRKNKE